MARLIDADKLREHWLANGENEYIYDTNAFLDSIDEQPTVDAVEVVLCKDCHWSKPYERTDGQTGYYCYFCGHAFKYGSNWERLFTPIKEADDFCSYGERRNDG